MARGQVPPEAERKGHDPDENVDYLRMGNSANLKDCEALNEFDEAAVDFLEGF